MQFNFTFCLFFIFIAFVAAGKSKDAHVSFSKSVRIDDKVVAEHIENAERTRRGGSPLPPSKNTRLRTATRNAEKRKYVTEQETNAKRPAYGAGK